MAGMDEPDKRCGKYGGNGNILWQSERRAVVLVLDLAKAFERVSFQVVWAGRHTSVCQGRSCGCFAVISKSVFCRFAGQSSEWSTQRHVIRTKLLGGLCGELDDTSATMFEDLVIRYWRQDCTLMDQFRTSRLPQC